MAADAPEVGALDMSVRCPRALARVIIIGVLAGSPCGTMAGDLSPRPSAIAMTSTSQESAIDLPGFSPTARSQEPFGGAVAELTHGALFEKWNTARTQLRIDADIVAACRAGPDACESPAARRIAAIVEEAKKHEGRALIGAINRAVNLTIAAASDKSQYGVEDKWASPLTTFASGHGDCEDYALAKYAALRAAGLAEDDLRLLIVRLPRLQTVHAVLSVRHDGRWLVLDNRRFAMLDAANLDAVPLFVMRENNRPLYLAAPAVAYDGSGTGTAPYLM